MSLNEDYLDDLLKAVTTEDGDANIENHEEQESAIERLANSVPSNENAEEALMEEPVIEEPAIEEPVIEEPIIEEPPVEEDIVEEPTTDVSDIEELLKSIEDEDTSAEEASIDDNQDIMSMLDGMSDDGDLAEIGDLLSKDENHEVIDSGEDSIPAENTSAGSLEDSLGYSLEDSLDDIPDRTQESADTDSTEEPIKEKKKLFGKKNKKSANAEEANNGEKKKSFFARILDLFFEEEDLDEAEPGVGEEGATAENQAILDELDGRKKPKAKKEKVKKEKKPKKKKEPKPKKPKKEKKPKKVKQPDPNEKPEKKIPRKKIIMVAIFAASVFFGIFLLTSKVPETITLQTAKKAYNDGDYRTVYTSLAGTELNKQNEELFNKVTVILEVQERYDAFLNFQKMDMDVEGLNSLLKGVEKYHKLYSYGEEWGVTQELDKTYTQLLAALSDNYGLSEDDITQILSYDRITYTKKLNSIVNGTEFVDPNAVVEEEPSLPDMLPEEEALLNMTVIGGDEADQKEVNDEELEDVLPEEGDITTEDSSMDNSKKNSKELYSGNVDGSNSSVTFTE